MRTIIIENREEARQIAKELFGRLTLRQIKYLKEETNDMINAINDEEAKKYSSKLARNIEFITAGYSVFVFSAFCDILLEETK